MNQKRNYNIPDSAIGFYGSGVYEIKASDIKLLKKCFKPIENFFIPLVGIRPVHASCRYLGYYDEVDEIEIQKIIEKIKPIYKKYLPLKCSIKNLTASWVNNPGPERKLLFANIEGEKIIKLHNELLKVTPARPLFKLVEGKNFRPHITLAELKKEYQKIPPEVKDFIKNFETDAAITFKGSYIWMKNGVKKLN